MVEEDQAQQPAEDPADQSNLGTAMPDQPVRPDPTEEAKQKEAELQEAQREHNARTGGADINEGEIAKEREEHNERSRTE